jgi:tetratricopeptide (TPR) repeat protein
MWKNSIAIWGKNLRKRCGTLTVFGMCILLVLTVFIIPSTSWYKTELRAQWNTARRNPLLMYYINRDDPDMAMWVGDYYFNGGAYDLPRAQASYEKALALDPHIEWTHYELARIEFVDGDFTTATQNLDTELQEYPQNLRPLYIRGLVDLGENNPAAAELDFTRFVAWAPTEWAGYNDLAYTLAEEGKYAQSAATIEQALKNVPNASTNPWLWNSLGLAQLNEVDYTQAQNSFSKALVLARQLTPVQWVRAYPGDGPAAAVQSINNFQTAIQNNLTTAQLAI